MSDERDPETDQPLPVKNDRPAIQDLVIQDIEDRKALGIKKYGTLLQSGNGRDMLKDAYDEALDQVIYLRGLIDERQHDSIRLAGLWVCRCGKPVSEESPSCSIHSQTQAQTLTHVSRLIASAHEAEELWRS